MRPIITPGYVLEGHVAVVEPDPARWAVRRATNPGRSVAITEPAAGIKVSPVFLGVDNIHRRAISGDAAGPPLGFETIVLGDYGDVPGHQRRYATWGAAYVGHNETVKAVKARLGGAEVRAGPGS